MKTRQNNENQLNRQTTIKHIKAPEILTTGQITNLACELSRKADGTIDGDSFETNCRKAYKILAELRKEIEQNADLSPE